MENWKIIDFAPNYAVSDKGRVKNVKKDRIIDTHMVKHHPTVNLAIDGKQQKFAVHTLVAKAFVPGWHEGWIVVYKDLNHLNLNASNLRWKPRYTRHWYEDEEIEL